LFVRRERGRRKKRKGSANDDGKLTMEKLSNVEGKKKQNKRIDALDFFVAKMRSLKY
jgi:hypothetical protein